MKIKDLHSEKIPTPLGIVYQKGLDKYEVCQYFDTTRKDQICGISIKNSFLDKELLWISIVNFDIEGPRDYDKLISHIETTSMKIPTYNDLARVYFVRQQVDEIIDLLQSHGVQADKFVGAYIISDRQNYNSDPKNKVLVFNFTGKLQILYTEVGKCEPYSVRLVRYW